MIDDGTSMPNAVSYYQYKYRTVFGYARAVSLNLA
jgi:hypothetical protein